MSYRSGGTSVIASPPLHKSRQKARGFGAPGKRQPIPIIATGSMPSFSRSFLMGWQQPIILALELEAIRSENSARHVHAHSLIVGDGHSYLEEYRRSAQLNGKQ